MPLPKRFTDEELRARKNERAREAYRQNRSKRVAYHAALYQQKKAADPDFLKKNAATVAARRAADPDADKAINKRSRDKHVEKRKAGVRAWFAANPEKRRAYEANRRAKKLECGGVVSPDILDKLMVLQRGKCACCKASLKEVKANLDHIVPLALNGPNSDENMQLLCQPCNNSKYAKHPVEFMQSRGYLL